MPLGPFFESPQTGQTDGHSVTGILPSEQPVVDQQLDTTLADLDRRNHDNTPGAALAEASCTDGGCRFMDHVTGCYYVINGDFMAISVRTFLFVGPQAIAARQTFRTI